jgi:hypothetical protein
MKTLLKFAFAAAVATALVKAILRQREERRNESGQGTAPGSSAEYAVPTLHAAQDAEPQRDEPLREGDLNVAQNAPF